MRHSNELRPYQHRIATHLYEHDEALCVVRPGGGKTIAALTAIEELLRDKVIRHALIVAPKRVARSVWPDEIAEWAHTRGLRYQVLTGPPSERIEQIEASERYQLTILGLDIVPWLLNEIETFYPDHPIFDLLVIDEISKLRDPKGQRVKALAKHINKWRMVWGLSGTLRPSSALDLFMPARVVTRGKLWGRSFYQWRKQSFYPVDYNGYDWKPLPGAEDKLNAEIAPYIATVAEHELIQPEPTIILDRVQLPAPARAQYRQMERKLMTYATVDIVAGSAAIASGKLAQIVAGSAAIASGKLAQIANGFIYDEHTTAQHVHHAKREWLEDLIENAAGPTLLIYEFREDLELIDRLLGPGLPYLGGGVSDAQAAANIALWNAGKLPFMALHPASGGHGLNLQHGGADMAWISPTWSPELWEQTIARLNRSGQRRQVIVRVCVADDTVDQMKIDRVHWKMTEQQAFEAYLRRWQIAKEVA